MAGFEFFAVCHSKNDTLNRGIERLGNPQYNGEFKRKLNLLTSYSQIFKKNIEKISIPFNHEKVMIDSGAYDFQIKKNSQFHFSPREYFDDIANLEMKEIIPVNYLVSMDHICAPVNSELIHKENLKKIKKTVKNAVELQEIFDKEQPNFKFIPVIQGYRDDEYAKCTKLMVKNNIISSNAYFGIGSLANRRKVKETWSVVNTVVKTLNDLGIKKPRIHLFGLNLNALKNPEIARTIKSFDSLSWTYPYRFGRVKLFTGTRMIEANTNKQLKEPEFYEISLRTTLLYVRYLNYKYVFERKIQDNEIFIEKQKIVKEIIQDILKASKIPDLPKIKENIDNEINNQRIFVFSGEKIVLLEPQNVQLSLKERYNIARLNLYQFLDTLNHSQKAVQVNIKNFEELKSHESFNQEFLILNNLLEPIFQYLEIVYNKRNTNIKGFNEKILKIQSLYSDIIPFLKETHNQRKITGYKKIREKTKNNFYTMQLVDHAIKYLVS